MTSHTSETINPNCWFNQIREFKKKNGFTHYLLITQLLLLTLLLTPRNMLVTSITHYLLLLDLKKKAVTHYLLITLK